MNKKEKMFRVLKAVSAPALNGKGDSKIWENAAAIAFGKEAAESSSAKLAWDEKNLFIYLRAQADDMAQRDPEKRAKPFRPFWGGNHLNPAEWEYDCFDKKIWNEDTFEIHMLPKGQTDKYYMFVANVAGKTYAAINASCVNPGLPWDSRSKLKLHKGSDFWSLEIAIPFEGLGGQIWDFTFYRTNRIPFIAPFEFTSANATCFFAATRETPFPPKAAKKVVYPKADRQRGYSLCIESPLVKIIEGEYAGSSNTKAELTLAGRETGSLLIPVTGVKKISSIKIDAELDALPGTKVATFMADYITSAWLNADKQIDIADALIPGSTFTLRAPRKTVPLFIDVKVPPEAPAGVYVGSITVQPGNLPKTVLLLKITVLPFTLPLASSLRTAFCFNNFWPEEYYGGKLTATRRRRYWQFILDHRLEPMTLFSQGGTTLNIPKTNLDMPESDLDWAVKRGKTTLYLPVVQLHDKIKLRLYKRLIRKYKGRLAPYLFGNDEVLLWAARDPRQLDYMQHEFAYAKKVLPKVPRINTTRIDPRLYGYVNCWCPYFSHYNHSEAEKRRALGEEVWWYPTDYPRQPYPNLNMDSPGVDPRILPWINWKMGITGLLYWSLNVEWRTVFEEAYRMNAADKKSRSMPWLTREVVWKIRNENLRWPEIPWMPFFRNRKTGTNSMHPGGGNLMYPGKDWTPYASIRLKNLRDGMQDYEYFVILKNLMKNCSDKLLIKETRKAIQMEPDFIAAENLYSQNPAKLIDAKNNLVLLITRALKTEKDPGATRH